MKSRGECCSPSSAACEQKSPALTRLVLLSASLELSCKLHVEIVTDRKASRSSTHLFHMGRKLLNQLMSFNLKLPVTLIPAVATSIDFDTTSWRTRTNPPQCKRYWPRIERLLPPSLYSLRTSSLSSSPSFGSTIVFLSLFQVALCRKTSWAG